MNHNKREQVFSSQSALDSSRHGTKMMTAQYINECVEKRNGMEVADKDGEIWGWVYDSHKNVGKWVIADTHDDRVKLMSTGFGTEELKPKYEPYHYTQGEGSIHIPFIDRVRVLLNAPANDDVKPYIIAVEGIDGAGKHTYTQKLAELLRARVVSFPQYGVTDAAELIEDGLREAEKYNPWHMAQLFAADRKESSSLLTGPGVIIVDRYVASNAAYLHAKTGYPYAHDAMEALEYDTLGLPKPDLQIFIDTPVTVAMGRAESRAESEGGEPDTNETDRELQERVRESYLKMVKSQWVSPWVVIDGQA